MKKHLELICEKLYKIDEENRPIAIFLFFTPYIIMFILYNLIFDTTETIWSIIINPFAFYGLFFLLLNHLRYQELIKIYKNYTTDEFKETLKDCYFFAYECNFRDKEEEKRYKPLAKDMLSINNTFAIYHLKENEDNINEFIKKEYLSKFNIIHCLDTGAGLYAIVFFATLFQLGLWGVIGDY